MIPCIHRTKGEGCGCAPDECVVRGIAPKLKKEENTGMRLDKLFEHNKRKYKMRVVIHDCEISITVSRDVSMSDPGVRQDLIELLEVLRDTGTIPDEFLFTSER